MIRITELYLNLEYNPYLDLFILLGTIVSYNYTKYNIYPKSFKKRPLIFGVSIICLLICCYLCTKLPLNTLLITLFFTLLVLLYSTPFKTSLRNIPSLKIFIIAFSWVGTTVILPYTSTHQQLTNTVILLSLQRFLFIILLTLPFDIRDYENDHKYLKTLPQLIGIEGTKRLGLLLSVIILVIEFIISPFTSNIVSILVVLLLLILLQKSTNKQSKYYCSFWVEAIPIVWYLSLVLSCTNPQP